MRWSRDVSLSLGKPLQVQVLFFWCQLGIFSCRERLPSVLAHPGDEGGVQCTDGVGCHPTAEGRQVLGYLRLPLDALRDGLPKLLTRLPTPERLRPKYFQHRQEHVFFLSVPCRCQNGQDFASRQCWTQYYTSTGTRAEERDYFRGCPDDVMPIFVGTPPTCSYLRETQTHLACASLRQATLTLGQ